MKSGKQNELHDYIKLLNVHVEGLLHLAQNIPTQHKTAVKDYLTSSFHEIVSSLDEVGDVDDGNRAKEELGEVDSETSSISFCNGNTNTSSLESKGPLFSEKSHGNTTDCMQEESADASNDTTFLQDLESVETDKIGSTTGVSVDGVEQDESVDDIANLSHTSGLSVTAIEALPDACNRDETMASVLHQGGDTVEVATEMGTVLTEVQRPHRHENPCENLIGSGSEVGEPIKMDVENKDDPRGQCEESEMSLLDEIDNIKPKSNIPSVKEGSPEADDMSDMSSLLSFLPQLSPFLKLDMQDNNIGDREGFIHLTVERADGSVQNLKIGGVIANAVDEQEADKQPVPVTDMPDKQTSPSQEPLKLPEKENNPGKKDVGTTLKPHRKPRPRGRPKKSQMFHPVLTKDNELVYACPFCPDVVKSEHAMKVHLRKHTGEKPYSCQICGKSFTTKGNMQQHERTKHSDAKPWHCPHCNKAFKEKKVLMVHERTHTGERPYKCHLCPKSFSQAGVLKEHLLVHSGQKPHLCDLCGQEFRGASALKVHKLRHLNKRDFKCNQCSKDFVSKNDLKRHYLSHSGVKPFLCSICPKSFTRLNYLKEHVNLHRGLKPYVCMECGEAFAESTTLHRHRTKKHQKADRESKQSELEKELTSGSAEPSAAATEILGQTSVQVVFDENTSGEDFQRLHSLVLSTASGSDYSLNAQDPVKQIYQVLCVNPDTQEISSISGVEGQSSTDFSAINLLASATAQQYTLQ